MAKPNRTKLSSDLIVAIYEEHEQEVGDLWAIMGDEDDTTTMRVAVEEWLARQLARPVTAEEL